ncbi:unnamed protein product [Cercospora beticola]|nr:unnamed protein product [Cercospora beticola]
MTAVPDNFDTHIPVNEKLPPLFHVDRQSRQKFAESFFGHPESLFVFYNAGVGQMCFESSHLKLIPRSHYIYPSTGRYTSPESCHQLLLKLGWEQATANSCQFHTQGKLPELLDEHLWGKTFGVTKRMTEPDVNGMFLDLLEGRAGLTILADHEHN